MKPITLAIALLLAVTSLSSVHADIPIDLLALIEKTRPAEVKPTPKVQVKPQLPAVAKSVVYRWRVKRINPPQGYQKFNWEGVTPVSQREAYRHLMAVHGRQLAEVTKHCDISSMSYRDLDGLHSALHCAESGYMAAYRVGVWETHCPADGGPCVHTFVFEIP